MRFRLSLLILLSCAIAACAVAEVDKETAASRSVSVGGAEIEILFTDSSLKKNSTILNDWVVKSASTVSDYYGQFPVKEVAVNLVATNGRGVKTGKTYQGQEIPQIIVWVGEEAGATELDDDWILVHEFIHLATASLPRRHTWLEEGLSVYIESISRAQAGDFGAEVVWREFIKRMPNGQPQAGDRGLDNTPTWGRKYWGGAVFCLLADVEIRRQSDNSLSLKDSLRSVMDAGLTINQSATIEQIIEAMDKPLPNKILKSLYEEYDDDGKPYDLDGLWATLGVALKNGEVVFNNNAKLADVRKAITSPG